MKEQILAITDKLQNGAIDYKEARKQLCDLFGAKYKPKVTGLAKVKSDTKWIYAGLTLPIIGIYMTYTNGQGFDIFPDGTSDYKLSLVGTQFEERHKANPYTVIHEKDLEILELHED